MAIEKYPYNISATANDRVDETSLMAEINVSPDIIIGLSHLGCVGTALDIWMKDTLPSAQETALDNVVAAHQGNPTADAPTADDGAPKVSPDLLPSGQRLYRTGRGDEYYQGLWDSAKTYNPYDSVVHGSAAYICKQESTNNEPPNATYWDVITSGVGIGQPFQASKSSEGDEVVTFGFNEVVRIVGGGVTRQNAEIDDYVDFRVFAPATVVEDVSGTGNLERQDLGGGMYRYDPGSSTNYKVNMLNAVPVPNLTRTGKWDYDIEANKLVPNDAGLGYYDIYNFQNELVEHVHSVWLLGDDHMCLTLPAVTPKIAFPQWRHKVTIHHGSGTHALKVVWDLLVGRVNTISHLLGQDDLT